MFKRRANIEVHNKTRFKWEALNAAFSSGTSVSVLPADVLEDQTIAYTGVQRSFSIFTGTAGVFTYSIHADNDSRHWKTLVVMWDVPFDYNIWGSNYWNAQITDGTSVSANLDLFWRLRNRHGGDPIKGQDQWRQLSTSLSTDNFTIKGCMSSNSDSKLTIIVSDSYNNVTK